MSCHKKRPLVKERLLVKRKEFLPQEKNSGVAKCQPLEPSSKVSIRPFVAS